MKLTPIQIAAHLVIRRCAERNQPGPTLDEIAEQLGVSKTRAVVVVEALERRGAVTWPRAYGRRLVRAARAV